MIAAQYQFGGITFSTDTWLIRPFNATDFEQFDELARQVHQILSDEKTLKFIPEKKLSSLQEAQIWLQKAILDFHTGRSYIHFISHMETGNLAGIIDILSPDLAKEYYRLENYPYFIEFYLISSVQGRLLMSNLLPKVLHNLRKQGILKLAAVVNRKNSASKRVLEKAGFKYSFQFDIVQDLFESV